MADAKTKPTKVSVKDFIEKVPDEQKRKDSYELLSMMESITGEKAVMWGPSIIGFGKYHYKYASGHEGDACLTGFSPRKAAISLYIMGAVSENQILLSRLGKYKKAVGCLYIKRLSDIDKKVLEQLIKESVDHLKRLYS